MSKQLISKNDTVEVYLDGGKIVKIFSPDSPKSKALYERYHMPIIITENGMCELDKVSEDGKVHDERRIESLKAYLKNLKKSVDEGTDVIGYFYWSLMDNFEWIYGYTERFGLIHVNYQTLERTIKDSGYVYSEIIKSNGENL